MLFGFAAELYLKSYLIHVGVDDKTLRSKALRHSISGLAKAAEERGLVCAELPMLVIHLDEKHSSYEFRYMQENSSYTAPSLDYIFGAFARLDLTIDNVVGASASKGLTPKLGWDVPPECAYWRMS